MEEAYRKYFESILETVSSFNDFDSYGHLDYKRVCIFKDREPVFMSIEKSGEGIVA